MFGMIPQSVHEKLRKAGVDTTQSGLWTNDQVSQIRQWYAMNLPKNKFDLQGLADRLGKNKSQVCLKAKKLGLTDMRRVYHARKRCPKFKTKEELYAHISASRKAWYAKNKHPRGALGMKHSEATKESISKSSKAIWSRMTIRQREDHITKSLKTKAMKNTPPVQRSNASWKAGWREIGEKRIYARSAWEANIGRMLEWRRKLGDISDWEHEPMTFWFEAIRRGVRSYKPDFRVTNNDGSQHFIEVKGWMDARSKTTLRRMKKYHPSIQIDLIDSKRYRALNNQLRMVIEGWEKCKI